MDVRIIDYNYAQLTETIVTASSSDPSFLASNIKNPIRSRVHRTSGNFVITSSISKINFKESGGGSELTATITAGTYTPTTLAAEIKAQMESAGGETYTVSFSVATGKWTITTGGAYLDLLWSTGTDTANTIGDTIGFDTSSDDTGATTYTGSNVAIHTSENIVFDLQTTEEVDSIAVLFDSIAGKKLTESAVLKIQANATDSWSSPAVDQTLTIDTIYSVATHFFSSDQSYRYWRVEITDPQNPNLYVETSTVMIGKAIQLGAIPGNGFQHEYEDQSEVQETEYGHRYADVRPLRRELNMDYPALSKTDIETIQTMYRRNGSVKPIFYAVDSGAEVYDKDRFFIYGYFSERLSYSQVVADSFSVPVSILEAM